MPNTRHYKRGFREPALAAPRLPHPSWGRPSEPARRFERLSAADFWNRLGV